MDLQKQFSQALMTPLVIEKKSFQASSTYDASLLAALSKHTQQKNTQQEIHKPSSASIIERLNLYQNQYWMRLFSTLQTQYPYMAWVMSHWMFNQLAAHYFIAHPPTFHSLERCGQAFFQRIKIEFWRLLHENSSSHSSRKPSTNSPSNSTSKLPSLQSLVHTYSHTQKLSDLLCTQVDNPWQRILTQSNCPIVLFDQAIRIDHALFLSFHQTLSPIWSVSDKKLKQIVHHNVVRYASHVTIIKENWPLAHRQQQELTQQNMKHSLTPLKDGARFWVFYRSKQGPARVQVSTLFAWILMQSYKFPIQQVIQKLQKQLSTQEYLALQKQLPQLMQQAIRSGWWIGIRSRSVNHT